MKIHHDHKLDYSDVLLVPQISSIESRADVDLASANKFGLKDVPIIAANMDGVGTFNMCQVLGKYKIFTALVKHYNVEHLSMFYKVDPTSEYAIYSMGAKQEDLVKYLNFLNLVPQEKQPKFVCIDVANGYTKSFLKFVHDFASGFLNVTVIAGNVVTPERVIELLQSGVDIVKVGIGPGSVCTTRSLTGVGYPQLSAVIECSKAARAHQGAIIADGGCTCPGDVAKAFAAGADYVMLGGMLAGHDEGGMVESNTQYISIPGVGDKIIKTPNKTVKFYGMASKIAQDIHNGGITDYRSSEGKEVLVPYRGPVENTIKHLLGGLRSACAYCGSTSLTDLHNHAEFIKVHRQSNELFSKN